MTYREREALAERARKEHWARHANNKTYEQWKDENDVNRLRHISHSVLGA